MVCRAFLCIWLVACASAPSEPPRSIVTIARHQCVVLDIGGDAGERVWACSNACRDFRCAAACPTAFVRPGTCPSDSGKGLLHRTFVERQTYERTGRCSDGEVADVQRVSCVDKSPEKKGDGGFGAVGAFFVLPLILVAIVAAAGQRT